MPWKEASPMSERIRFIHDHQLGVYDMTELCHRYGVSRKTGYKWLSRFIEGGFEALKDRSRRPHSCPHKTGSRLSRIVPEALTHARTEHQITVSKPFSRRRDATPSGAPRRSSQGSEGSTPTNPGPPSVQALPSSNATDSSSRRGDPGSEATREDRTRP